MAIVDDTLLEELLDTLDEVGCQFNLCNGPTLEPEPMRTCHRCETLAKVRVAAGRPPRRDDEMTAEQSIEYMMDRFLAEARPR